jgi:hypothetical protein
VTRLYSLKAYYLGLLGNLFEQASSEYHALAAQGNSSYAGKTVMNKYISKAADLESQCDEKVYAILSELEDELSENGGDKTLVDTIENAYIKEKRLKKSYYLSTYKY